ncbi:hypothetical protein CKO11_00825 [Rhodobacter sp. TJ_12]|nr:hypothetical protein [Rhodobacter sp. TJ_12]
MPTAPGTDPAPRFRLPLHLKQMGDPENCRHRSGWHFVMAALRPYHDPEAVLLDDFVERSFQHAYCRQTWTTPWVGIFHHPPCLPEWLDPTAPPAAYMATAAFRESVRHLLGAVALSRYLGDWLRDTLDVPVLVLKHPSETAVPQFDPARYLAQPLPQVVQVGWYGRNIRAIYQVPLGPSFHRIHLLQRRPWVLEALERTDALSPLRDLPISDKVELRDEVENDDYDALLSSSIVFCQYWDLSASNTLIECIARATPIVLNRHPAAVEYLGAAYPLFYDTMDEAAALIATPERVTSAHRYLSQMDRTWLAPAGFAQQLGGFVAQLSRAAELAI